MDVSRKSGDVFEIVDHESNVYKIEIIAMHPACLVLDIIHDKSHVRRHPSRLYRRQVNSDDLCAWVDFSNC